MLRILNIARLRRIAPHCALLLVLVLAAGCERSPLLAPSNSTITLTALASAVPTNGSTLLIATVLEPSGTPPHSGTHVIFTTNLGTIEPSEVETDLNGRAQATFRAGLANGTATITASSGGSQVAAANVLKIAVGTAAISSISVTASPTSLPPAGGPSNISARVFDINGHLLPCVLVSFSLDNGGFNPSGANTDSIGTATTTLT